MDTRPIWEGPLGNTGWSVKILPIADHMTRGTLTLYDAEKNLKFQKEVSVTRREPLGGTPRDMAEWHKTVTTWFHNNA